MSCLMNSTKNHKSEAENILKEKLIYYLSLLSSM